ncbi:hypothetical protein C7M84_010938 [Penaeus vannamei]|uniref:Uncharacterized protein n=1 Tax=Penaeus vannamei TaxID=6689 RepID=A0A423T2P3_PENVA|nr:hypothetical protein C7M84_010938 [Penaeus vannamei]
MRVRRGEQPSRSQSSPQARRRERKAAQAASLLPRARRARRDEEARLESAEGRRGQTGTKRDSQNEHWATDGQKERKSVPGGPRLTPDAPPRLVSPEEGGWLLAPLSSLAFVLADSTGFGSVAHLFSPPSAEVL